MRNQRLKLLNAAFWKSKSKQQNRIQTKTFLTPDFSMIMMVDR